MKTPNYTFDGIDYSHLPKTFKEYYENRSIDSPEVRLPSIDNGLAERILNYQDQVEEYIQEFYEKFPTVEKLLRFQHRYEKAIVAYSKM